MLVKNELEKLKCDSRTPLIIAAFLGALFLFSLWEFMQTFVVRPTPTKPFIQKIPTQVVNLSDLHLFGIYTASDNLPITQLPFKLEGTIVFTDSPNQSRAIIASDASPSKVYQTGNILPGNITLTRIAKNYVVLDDNGTLEKLALPIQLLSNNG